MFFELLLDIFWIVIIYSLSYHLWHIFLSKHSTVLKDLFDISVRYNDYRLEQSTQKQHESLYVLACTTMVLCMIVTPVIHSIMYLLFYSMIDVVKLNKILLTIVSAKILWYLNIRDRKFYLRPWKNVNEAFLVIQFVFLCINYDNTTTVIPSLFQIIDELSNFESVFITMSKQYTSLFNTESSMSERITNIIVKIKTNKDNLIKLQVFILSVIIMVSILYSNLKTNGEIIFYYYAIARLFDIMWNH